MKLEGVVPGSHMPGLAGNGNDFDPGPPVPLRRSGVAVRSALGAVRRCGLVA